MPDRPFRSLWEARELLYLLTRREIRLRYQHSIVGIGWAVLQPLVTLLALTMFQVIMGRRSSGTVPYPLYAVIGLVPWTFLSHALTQSSHSVSELLLADSESLVSAACPTAGSGA
jgi:lipopolysaccharide transport system permease protein